MSVEADGPKHRHKLFPFITFGIPAEMLECVSIRHKSPQELMEAFKRRIIGLFILSTPISCIYFPALHLHRFLKSVFSRIKSIHNLKLSSTIYNKKQLTVSAKDHIATCSDLRDLTVQFCNLLTFPKNNLSNFHSGEPSRSLTVLTTSFCFYQS